VQRRALGVLFTVLGLAFAAVAVAALADAGGGARRWLIGVAAVAVALWFASLAAGAFRRRRH
jgi:hypothetical protein